MTLDDADPSGSALAAPFVALADALLVVPASAGAVGVVERVVQAACQVVPGAEVVSVVLRSPAGCFETVASNHALAEGADRVQDEEGEGPSLTAVERTGVGSALAHDLATDDTWPRFGARVADELGLHSSLSTGMFPGGEPPRFGALNFYSRKPRAFGADDKDRALVLAAHAATAISAVQARTAGELREAQLTEALQSRDVIGQAKGILMERRGLGADEAFELLRRTSQNMNMKLREVAATLATRRPEL
jgi:GAF domain-containing protein